jgi:hypothetical protein
MEYRQELEKILDYLKQERDEINLKLHLGQKDLQDEMAGLEKQWQDLRQRGDKVLNAADESSEDLAAALTLLGNEIKASFEKVKDALKG